MTRCCIPTKMQRISAKHPDDNVNMNSLPQASGFSQIQSDFCDLCNTAGLFLGPPAVYPIPLAVMSGWIASQGWRSGRCSWSLIFRYIQYCLEWRKARIEDNRRWSVTGIHPARSSAGRRVGRSRWWHEHREHRAWRPGELTGDYSVHEWMTIFFELFAFYIVDRGLTRASNTLAICYHNIRKPLALPGMHLAMCCQMHVARHASVTSVSCLSAAAVGAALRDTQLISGILRIMESSVDGKL